MANDTVVLVDGSVGEVRADPGAAELARARTEPRRIRTSPTEAGPGMTKDGHPVPLLANVGGPAEAEAAAAAGAEGVGLFRTEFMFLGRAAAPARAEQVTAYRAVLEAFPGRPVVVRVLDAGSDKPLAFLPPAAGPPAAGPHVAEPRVAGAPAMGARVAGASGAEEGNPALGERGLRLLRRHPAVLDDQLAALAEAIEGTSAELNVMAPMVADAEEARYFTERCRRAGIERSGIMIEVPAAALRAADLAAETGFFSVGTNDLAQYAFAADRERGALGRFQDPWQPALLDLVALAAGAAARADRPCGVCGEAAADPALACVLTGIGVTSLSMGAAMLPAVRAALAAHTLAQCTEAAQAARAARTAVEARASASKALPHL
jgi:phosphotransferase system enzyme I (PtsI)